MATTSAGLAFLLGRRDGEAAISRAEALANAAALVGAVDLPVSADLEDGFGPAPEDAAATVTAAIGVGLCGCTIEDTTADPAAPIHGFDAAVARIAAAARAARASPHPFILTARAENFLHGRPDLDDTIRRLTAFAEAGADCLYAPALPDEAAIRAVVAAELGVRRVSVGGAIARAAYGAALEAGRALLAGDLPAIAALTPYARIAPHMRAREEAP